ncbi:MAG: YceH family protein [Candidatus Acidiferrum sp.]
MPTVNILLNDVEARVLGALVEKEITTPDYYPLSLNALVNACNQKNNRDPITTLDEAAVREALHSLSDQALARSSSVDSRVTKFEHRLQEVFNFNRHEIAILCVLLLRGPQTPGELRTRSERLHPFEDLSEVQSGLRQLMTREPPLAAVLLRQPGTKEARYAHLLSGDVYAHSHPTPEASPAVGLGAGQTRHPESDPRVAILENEVSELKRELADLRKQLTDFQKRFE